MQIRKYQPSDCEQMAQLFYDTVHYINAKDYTIEQLNVWATGEVDLVEWNTSFLQHFTVVAVEGEQIVGFGDIDKIGYLDRLYVHKDYQRRGIATIICDHLEQECSVKKMVTHAAITARPFFEQREDYVLKEQKVERKGIYLTNYVMQKDCL